MICRGDLIGETEQELRALHFLRDRAWLQSELERDPIGRPPLAWGVGSRLIPDPRDETSQPPDTRVESLNMAMDNGHHTTTAARRRRAAENAIASARLEGLDPSTLSAAIDAYVRGERTIDELIAEALNPAGEHSASLPPQAA